MKKDVAIAEIMSRKLITLHPKERLVRAKEVFDQYDIHHIPIEVMGKVRGIVSLGDILFLENVATNSFDEFIQTKKLELTTVDSVMTARPITVKSTSKISETLEIMLSKGVNALPVVDEEETLVGIVTSQDMMTYLQRLLKD